jgi:phosphate-selective porin OprO and OprP
LGEYVETKQAGGRVTTKRPSSDTLNTTAWQLSAAVFLTGENETYFGFSPKSPIELGGPGWGAFELALRVHGLDVEEAAFAGGFASFADPSVSARQLDYERTRFTGGAANGGDRPDEKALLTRFFLAF